MDSALTLLPKLFKYFCLMLLDAMRPDGDFVRPMFHVLVDDFPGMFRIAAVQGHAPTRR